MPTNRFNSMAIRNEHMAGDGPDPRRLTALYRAHIFAYSRYRVDLRELEVRNFKPGPRLHVLGPVPVPSLQGRSLLQ